MKCPFCPLNALKNAKCYRCESISHIFTSYLSDIFAYNEILCIYNFDIQISCSKDLNATYINFDGNYLKFPYFPISSISLRNFSKEDIINKFKKLSIL